MCVGMSEAAATAATRKLLLWAMSMLLLRIFSLVAEIGSVEKFQGTPVLFAENPFLNTALGAGSCCNQAWVGFGSTYLCLTHQKLCRICGMAIFHSLILQW